MKIARHTDKDFSAKLREVAAESSLFDAEIEQRTKAILHDVFVRGDDAVLDFTEKFDGAKLSAGQLAVTQAELMAASLKADESLRAAVAEAEANIVGFAKKSIRKNWPAKIRTARAWAKSLIRSSASAFTFPAAPRRWSRRR